jgi:hypothetical protein
MPAKSLQQALVLGVVALVLATGFCLFDAHHAAGGDLCASLLMVATSLLLTFHLTPTGRLAPRWVAAPSIYPSGPPAPPPRA